MGQAQISQACCDGSCKAAVHIQRIPVLEWSATEDAGDVMSSVCGFDSKMSEECGRSAPLQPHFAKIGSDEGCALCEDVQCTPGYERFKDKSLTQWYEDEGSDTTLGDHDSSSNHSNSDDHSGSHNDAASAQTEVFFLYDISRAESGLSC